MKRILLVITVALVMAAMMLAMAMPAFAQPGGSENSCGASNPNIDAPADHPNKGGEWYNCGFRNSPHKSGGAPPGQAQ
jgi:hypothetical protein